MSADRANECSCFAWAMARLSISFEPLRIPRRAAND
jgi:hypothetical protein